MEPALLEFLPSVALAIALASCAGLRAFLPLLLTAAVARAGYLELGPGFQFLASDRALVLFALAALLEFLGDKIPVVDHTLDALGTLLRPAAGALLAASVMWRVEDPLVALVLGLVVGAPAAIVPHAAKTTLRTVSTTLTAGLANPLISLLEDAISIGLFVLAVLVPLLVAMLVVLTAVWMMRRLRARPRRPATAS